MLNPTKYVLTRIGYTVTGGYPGSIFIDSGGSYMVCLDAPNYTLYELKASFFNNSTATSTVGKTFKLKFTTTTFDTNLKSVNCDYFDFNVVL